MKYPDKSPKTYIQVEEDKVVLKCGAHPELWPFLT